MEKSSKAVLFMDKYSGPTVALSGRVVFPDYTGGAITIFVSRRCIGPPDIILAKIPCPGEYSVRIPKDLGGVYLRATSLAPGEKLNKHTVGSTGRYGDNPLKVGSVDIKGADLVITQKPFLLMDFYPGPTVNISGRVAFPGYENREVVISARTKDYGPTDIAILTISQPGEYTVKLPKNFGSLYLRATAIIAKEKTFLNKHVIEYEHNPVKVGASDIKDIDIVSVP